MFNRAEIIDRQLVQALQREATPQGAPRDAEIAVSDTPHAPSGRDLLELYDSQVTCRQLDLVAREMRARGESFYTIASAGHEGNAVVGRLTRHTDPAFLHYRSGALMAERARKLAAEHERFVYNTLLSLTASSEEPISGGRHKVWGSRPLWVLPQTSTIASHLPKAVGTALALDRARRMGKLHGELSRDSIVVCSFGDASANHSTSQGAFNFACYATHQRVPVPLLLVCEDNQLGISVPTPGDWIEKSLGQRVGLHYVQADGLDIVDAYQKTAEAVSWCRQRRSPVLLHLRVVRMLGHAGSDMEASYRSIEQIESTERLDPVLGTARRLVALRLATPQALLARYHEIGETVRAAATRAAATPKLTSAEQIIEPLAPHRPEAVAAVARGAAPHERRLEIFGGTLPEQAAPRHMAVQINRALHDLLAQHEDALTFGEDVAKKGGVYHLTAGLLERFGPGRVFNTMLDEQTILGLAQGFANVGLLPVPEIQYLAYLHNAVDQLRGEACSLQFFSRDQFRNPMVARIASFAYQKGFGGHFHNDNSVTSLRDIPALIIAAPSRGDDAVRMLRSCFAAAQVDGRVVAFLEPIARYMTRDLYDEGDGLWATSYPPPGEALPIGRGAVFDEEHRDLCIISYANGVWLSLRAARTLEREHGIRARVVDLRWLAPLDEHLVVEQARACSRVLIVDEGRKSGGVAEPLLSAIALAGEHPPLARVVGEDTFIPLGPAANTVLPTEDSIVQTALALCK